ncbi:MAG: cysteine--tRNA ligase [Candidatus Omnitrophica bacterium]|nr:cysteine--tRNA ligase [Candidatus Omnitrophota bacterium]MBD3269164.1 cysteine--tRNA ligase [Candidatus Omnitrophota bacterium]
MMLKIYNSLSKKKEVFAPRSGEEVRMYTCGVTVYDDCHIGHARSLYVFEVMRRYLRYRGFKVRFIRNITDVDDKIIQKARLLADKEKIDLSRAFEEVKDKYIRSYYEDLDLLSIAEADREPKATENIKDMQGYIQKLIEKGFAYESGGNVYFSVRKFPSYGKLSGKRIDDLFASVRIEADPSKKDPLDFALWKKAKEGEPFWDSPWGEGRPGWHIECSVMSQKYLDTETLDIHGGGKDLIFPHHENERAQSSALTGKPFANFWIHHGLLTINGQKMAKSLGNFVTIKNFIKEHKDPDILKLFFLSAHYSHPVDYNKGKIEEVKKQKRSFDEFFDRINLKTELRKGATEVISAGDKKRIDALYGKAEESMDDDFNMPKALGHIFEIIDTGSKFISCDKKDASRYAEEKVRAFFEVFGLEPKKPRELEPELIELVKRRDRARREKDFAEADKIREKIAEVYNLEVIDTASGVTFVNKASGL